MSRVTQLSRFAFFLSFSLINLNYTFGSESLLMDSCTVNDDCLTATTISNVISDQSYVCIEGCNLNASPDPLVAGCQMGDYPTVWFRVVADSDATVMNIEVKSTDFESPVISLFVGNNGCNALEQVHLSNSNLSCIIGSHGVAMAIGTPINHKRVNTTNLASGVYILSFQSGKEVYSLKLVKI
jgi:hypothetical protein